VPGFRAEVPFVEGIRRSLAWFDDHPEAKTVDLRIDAEYETVLAAWSRARNAACRTPQPG
jgi:hypothetical protein